MCAMVRGHRGDCGGGGDLPPRGLRRLPTLCETSKKKNTRGASKGKKLEKILKANGKRPLPLVFDTSYADTYRCGYREKKSAFKVGTNYVAQMTPETKQIQGAIDIWHDMHNKEYRGWANNLAKNHYEQLQSELAASEAQQGMGSSSGGSSVNEQEIFNKVFGDRRGRNIGVGQKIKKKSSVSSSTTQPTPTTVEMENMIRFVATPAPPFDYNAYKARFGS